MYYAMFSPPLKYTCCNRSFHLAALYCNFFVRETVIANNLQSSKFIYLYLYLHFFSLFFPLQRNLFAFVGLIFFVVFNFYNWK